MIVWGPNGATVRPRDPLLATQLADFQARTLQELADRESVLAELEVVPFVISSAPLKESKRATPPKSESKPYCCCVDLKACPFIARITGNRCVKCQKALCESCRERLKQTCSKCR